MNRTYDDAASRWAGVGPYYAMFPVAFADEVVQSYTRPRQTILDPFAGRGTAVFSAVTHGRAAIGIEINPVGYVYTAAKLGAATREAVERRLDELGDRATQFKEEAAELPSFFHHCFTRRVRMFLLAARADLNWRQRKVDRTVMALLLIYLHGKTGAALSNQFRQTKSMSPQYAMRWWKERKLNPPDVDPVSFLKSRVAWRYARGVPEAKNGHIYLGNSIKHLPRLHHKIMDGSLAKASLLFTSPPYCAVTNYHYDQWLRLWQLGGPPNALRNGNGRSGKFEGREAYRKMLEQVFTAAVPLLTREATIYVRTDARAFTYHTTMSVLRGVFPKKHLREIRRPMVGASQTHLFNETLASKKTGEIDLVLSPR
jgi:hypothetical protein